MRKKRNKCITEEEILLFLASSFDCEEIFSERREEEYRNH